MAWVVRSAPSLCLQAKTGTISLDYDWPNETEFTSFSVIKERVPVDLSCEYAIKIRPIWEVGRDKLVGLTASPSEETLKSLRMQRASHVTRKALGVRYMRRLPISCFIIAKDEADRIGRTIESVQPWVNEVIVVDSGSTDDTMAVATRAGARAISNAWPGFGQQKRFAEDQCTNDWLLNIDADEVVTPELCREIEALFANGSPPSRRLRNAGSIGLSWSVEAKAVGPRPLVHPPVRSPRRSLSRVGSARFGRDRQSSVRKTSGCPAPLFDALVWRHETQVERADMAFGRACRASFERRTYPTLVDRNADELPASIISRDAILPVA